MPAYWGPTEWIQCIVFLVVAAWIAWVYLYRPKSICSLEGFQAAPSVEKPISVATGINCIQQPLENGTSIWFCPNETEADRLINPTSPTTTYLQPNGKDTVCIQESSTSKTYFCRDLRGFAAPEEGRFNALDTVDSLCTGLIPSFYDLSDNLTDIYKVKTLADSAAAKLATTLTQFRSYQSSACAGAAASGPNAAYCATLGTAISKLTDEDKDLKEYIANTVTKPIPDAEAQKRFLLEKIKTLGRGCNDQALKTMKV